MLKIRAVVSCALTICLAVVGAQSAVAASQQSAVEQGKKVYQRNCVACHQKDAVGKPGVAPSLINQQFLSTASDQFLVATIAKGRAGTAMTAWGEQLGAKKIKAIITFLSSHTQTPNRSAKVNAEPESMGNAKLGKVWFQSICANCHGIFGQGYAADGSGTAIGGVDFLRLASDGFIRETIKHGRDNTRMRSFSGPAALANLNDSEIDDIISYMRTLRIPEDI
ncbi:MAG TPA: c-type cytochrome [Gammaproteobacteria bacterium]|nr:c-type cytochrome [Gammaproteobacteria bacterium]